jgi:hypothetical protein
MWRAVLVALPLSVGSYVAFRQTQVETWARDLRTYVIFPVGAGRQ